MNCRKCGQTIRSFEELKEWCPKRFGDTKSGQKWHVLNMLDMCRLPDRKPSHD